MGGGTFMHLRYDHEGMAFRIGEVFTSIANPWSVYRVLRIYWCWNVAPLHSNSFLLLFVRFIRLKSIILQRPRNYRK